MSVSQTNRLLARIRETFGMVLTAETERAVDPGTTHSASPSRSVVVAQERSKMSRPSSR
jgi:hypothetical protein